jgi:putative PEP-CTERM system histidine kinase
MGISLWAFPSFFITGACVLLAAIIVWHRSTHSLFFPLLLVLAVLAWIHGLNAMSYLVERNPLIWKKLVLLGELTLPVAMGFMSHAWLRKFSSYSGDSGSGWWRIMMAGGAVLLGIRVLAIPDGFMQVNLEGEIVFSHPEGLTIWGFIVTAMFLVLFRLEQIFRSCRDPLRYRLKYVLIGLGGLACISIAQAIHMMVVSVVSQDVVWAGGMAVLSSLLLLGFGIGRWQEEPSHRKFQISHHARFTSLTVVCVAGYLVLVGFVVAVIQKTDWEVKESLGALLVFLAVLGLVVVMLSRHARAEFRKYVLRHFFSTKYDYREKWLEVTETFTACKNNQQVWNRYLEWLGCTFGASRVTIWKYFDVDGRYHQIRKERRQRLWSEVEQSSAIPDPLPIPETHPLILQMKRQQESVVIQAGQGAMEDWGVFLHVTQAHVCVPLLTGEGGLLGFCTLSKPLAGKGYDQEDLDLLRAIAHHVTMLLLQFKLLEERSSAAKWEAVHRFSAFYLHDLKNLAGSLSLLVQNAEQFGQDPEFQSSAMRTIRTTSQRIIDLMRELANQAKEPILPQEISTQTVDLNQLVTETLAAVHSPGCLPEFHPGQEVPLIRLKVESIKQVLLNLILNACQATGENGRIDIFTAYDGEQVIVEIVDTGVGMSMFQLENLFQPFTSSKTHGLGVGLFQCKRIVEDHHGMIHIESEEGQGTTVIITFPVQNADNSTIAVSGVSKAGTEYAPNRNG